MRLLINGTKSPLAPETGETLGHLFMRLEDHFHQSDQVAISVSLDGVLLTPEQQSTQGQLQADRFQVLDIETIPMNHLALKTLEDLRPLLANTAQIARDTAAALQAGRHEECQDTINSILQIWAVFFDTVTNASKLHDFQLADIALDGETFADRIEVFSGHLRQVQEAMRHRDFVTVADILEYEIAAATDGWLRAHDALTSHLRGLLAHGTA